MPWSSNISTSFGTQLNSTNTVSNTRNGTLLMPLRVPPLLLQIFFLFSPFKFGYKLMNSFDSDTDYCTVLNSKNVGNCIAMVKLVTRGFRCL